MKANALRAFEILRSSIESKDIGLRACASLLTSDRNSRALELIVPSERKVSFDELEQFLNEAAEIQKFQREHRNITDWPFEHFWTNPRETKHSKLLGYFIDPDASHHCGDDFLQRLLKVWNLMGVNVPSFRPNCCVSVEKSRIDILIQCPGHYAIIIENKVNGAVNQGEQLERYVHRVHAMGYDYSRIFVCYLPLDERKHPDSRDLKAIAALGVNYSHVTFRDHITCWLNDLIDSEWPSSRNIQMRENLLHYRSLLNYLANKTTITHMKEHLLKKLQHADEQGERPSWCDAKELEESSTVLRKCLEQVLRGKLLLSVQRVLKERGIDSAFNPGNGEQQSVVSAYDSAFMEEQNITIPAHKCVNVCFGCYEGDSPEKAFWFGYLRSGDESDQNIFEPLALKAAGKMLNPKALGLNKPWYAWSYTEIATYSNCEDAATVTLIVNKLVEMMRAFEEELTLSK